MLVPKRNVRVYNFEAFLKFTCCSVLRASWRSTQFVLTSRSRQTAQQIIAHGSSTSTKIILLPQRLCDLPDIYCNRENCVTSRGTILSNFTTIRFKRMEP